MSWLVRNIATKEEHDIIKLLNYGDVGHCEKLNRDHIRKKKEIENIVKIRKNDFNDILKLSLRIWEKLKTLKSKKSGLTDTNIFEKAGIAKVNR